MIVLYVIAAYFILVGLYRASWWIRFLRKARIRNGIVTFKIEERNVK